MSDKAPDPGPKDLEKAGKIIDAHLGKAIDDQRSFADRLISLSKLEGNELDAAVEAEVQKIKNQRKEQS